MKALVVDDSSTMRRIITNSLDGMNMEVLEAGNGKEALTVLQGEAANVAVILLDWNMPEMNGLETLKAIRADDATKGIPVVMVTTEAEKGNVVTAIQEGANQYVVKPFQKEGLQEKIQKVMGG